MRREPGPLLPGNARQAGTPRSPCMFTWHQPADGHSGQSCQLASWPGAPSGWHLGHLEGPPTASHRHAAGSASRWAGRAAELFAAASWLCCAWCLGTSGLALVGRRADRLASYGWAAGSGSEEGFLAPPGGLLNVWGLEPMGKEVGAMALSLSRACRGHELP